MNVGHELINLEAVRFLVARYAQGDGATGHFEESVA